MLFTYSKASCNASLSYGLDHIGTFYKEEIMNNPGTTKVFADVTIYNLTFTCIGYIYLFHRFFTASHYMQNLF